MIILVLLTLQNIFFGQNVQLSSLEEKTSLDGLWEVQVGSRFKPGDGINVTLPTNGFIYPEEESNTYWFRRTFKVSNSLKDQEIGLFLGRLPDATSVYLNGSLLLKSGVSPPEGYYGALFTARSLIVPNELLNYNQDNEILLKVYTEKSVTALPSIYFSNIKAVQKDVFRSRMLNSYMGLVAASLSFLTSLYFLILFLLNRKDKSNLFLMLGSIGFCLNVSSLFIESSPLPYLLMFKLQSIGLYWGTSFYILFIQQYMKLHRGLKIRRFFLIAPAVMTIALLVMPNFNAALFLNDSVFYIAYITPGLFYMLYLSIRGRLDKIHFSSILLTGVTLAILGGLRDIIIIMGGNSPAFYTNVIGMVSLVVCLFISYAARFHHTNRISEQGREELLQKNKESEELIARISKLVLNMNKSSIDLETSIQDAADAVHNIVDANKEMEVKVKDESKIVKENGTVITKMLKTFDEMGDSIQNQTAMVEETTSAVTQQSSSIASVSTNTERAKEHTGELRKFSNEATESVKTNHQVMTRIQSISEEVQSYVGDIRKIASTINLLSMNASIEAAHAGEYGRGFAVVAEEVRKLAEDSGKSSSAIVDTIKEMMATITQGVTLTGTVQNNLLKITKNTADTDDLIREINEAAREQSVGAQQITQAARQLQDATSQLMTDSQEQQQGVEQIRISIEEIETLFDNMVRFTEELNKGTSTVSDVVLRLQSVAETNRETRETLAELVQKHKASY